MNFDSLHRWWRRNGHLLMLAALTALVLSRAYVMWRDRPHDAPDPPARSAT